MANIRSQIKRNRQTERRRRRNKAIKSALKTAIGAFHTALRAGDTNQADTALRAASRKLDQAASAGVIHRNQAANRKSAIAHRLAVAATEVRLHAATETSRKIDEFLGNPESGVTRVRPTYQHQG